MLSKKIEAALNEQINHEMEAFYNYLAMEAWFEDANLSGFARWMKVQSAEELDHMRRVFEYINDRGGKVHLEQVNKPTASFKTPREVFARAAELEQANTKSIHRCYALAVEERDYATQTALQWFINEQVEEEKITKEITALLDRAGDEAGALLILNRQFGDRAGEGAKG